MRALSIRLMATAKARMERIWSSVGIVTNPHSCAAWLAPLGWNVLQLREQSAMMLAIDGTLLHRGARRIVAEIVVAVPVGGWPDGPGHEAAAAVRAYVEQH